MKFSTTVKFLALTLILLFGGIELSAKGSEKRGAGLWFYKGSSKGLKNSKVTWFYNWKPKTDTRHSRKIEFVPMIWSKKHATDANFKMVKKSSKILLGFNEPDHKNQGDTTVEEALALWPKFERTGLRLGSPAMAGNALNDQGWLGKFMKGVEEKQLRVDFICVHKYYAHYDNPEKNVEKLKDYLTKIYEKYKKPIWLTEFALSNWKTPATQEQQIAYMEKVLPMLDSLECVERYAWFALPFFAKDSGSLVNSNLCDEKGALNKLGKAYAK